MDTLCERAHDGSNLTAFVGIAVCWGDLTGHTGEVAPGKYKLEYRRSRHIENDELNLGDSLPLLKFA